MVLGTMFGEMTPVNDVENFILLEEHLQIESKEETAAFQMTIMRSCRSHVYPPGF